MRKDVQAFDGLLRRNTYMQGPTQETAFAMLKDNLRSVPVQIKFDHVLQTAVTATHGHVHSVNEKFLFRSQLLLGTECERTILRRELNVTELFCEVN